MRAVCLIHQFLFDTVTYREFYSRWIYISNPETQHITVQYNQQLSENTFASASAISHTRIALTTVRASDL